MILYALQCDAGHAFDAWFRDSDSFDEQVDAGVLTCPVCDSDQVSKAIMAPRLSRHHGVRDGAPPPAPGSAHASGSDDQTAHDTPSASACDGSAPARASASASPSSVPPDAEDMRRTLGALRRVVEATCDNVGPRFAEEARRIHYGEATARGIFGRASDEEADALREEGVEFASIPWPRRDDA